MGLLVEGGNASLLAGSLKRGFRRLELLLLLLWMDGGGSGVAYGND